MVWRKPGEYIISLIMMIILWRVNSALLDVMDKDSDMAWIDETYMVSKAGIQ
ncbi:MAG: hypothetical protein ACLR1A_02860 [Eubacterium ventriosum]